MAAACLGLLTAVACGGFAVTRATAINVGSLRVSLTAELAPKGLPRFQPKPVAARVGVSIAPDNGRLPPKLRSVELSLDRHINLQLRDGADCRISQLKNTPPPDALRTCGAALVGDGRAQAIVSYPGQPRFRSRGRILIFSGAAKSGQERLLIHSFFPRPVRAASVSSAAVVPVPGPRFGKALEVKTPKIAGGNGRLVAIYLRLGGRDRQRASGPSVQATCPSQRLVVLTEVNFAQPLGTLKGGRVLPCGR